MGILWGWALQGYSECGHSRASLQNYSGVGHIQSIWAVQESIQVWSGHSRNHSQDTLVLDHSRDTLRLGTGGVHSRITEGVGSLNSVSKVCRETRQRSGKK